MMRSLVIALLIFGSIPFIFRRPFFGLLVWSLLSYMSPYRLTYGFAYSFPWVMLIAIVTLISIAISKEDKRIEHSGIALLFFALLVWTTITTVFSVLPAAAWVQWKEFAKIMIAMFVTLMLVKSRERMHLLVWMIAISLGFYGIKGGLFTLLHGGGNHVLGPPGSFLSDNNALAMALCTAIPLMRYLQLHSVKKWVKVGLGASMFLTGVAVLGTYSRGGLIALVIVAGMLLLKSRGRIAIALTLVLVGGMAVHFMPPQWVARMDTLHHAEKTDSGKTRIQSWEFSVNVALHRPVLGGGFNVYESDSMWAEYGPAGAIPRAVHSIYFKILGEQGFPGLFMFLALLALSWRNCMRVRKRTRADPKQRWAFDLASMIQVSLVAYIVGGAFLPLSYFSVSYQLFALTAVLWAFCRKYEEVRAGAKHAQRSNAQSGTSKPARA